MIPRLLTWIPVKMEMPLFKWDKETKKIWNGDQEIKSLLIMILDGLNSRRVLVTQTAMSGGS